MDVSAKQLIKLLPKVLAANLVSMIHGSPALGKSDIVRSVADTYKLKLIDVRLSQADPVDLAGLINFSEDKTRSTYVPMDLFPIEGDVVPNGFNGWLIFLDEIPSASLAVQAAAYRLILDREVGQHKLHPNVWIICAGNLSTDKAIVNRMGTAMQSRLIHFNLKVNFDDWMEWANKEEIDYRIISFLKFKPELLHNFNPNHADNTFPAPRTWHFLSKMIKDQVVDFDLLPLIVGTVGEGAGYEFKAFIEVMDSLPSFEKMLNNPESISISDDPSIMYAMSGLISYRANKDNMEQLMKLVNRFPLEFQIITLQDLIKYNKALISVPAINNWIIKNGATLSKKGVI